MWFVLEMFPIDSTIEHLEHSGWCCWGLLFGTVTEPLGSGALLLEELSHWG